MINNEQTGSLNATGSCCYGSKRRPLPPKSLRGVYYALRGGNHVMHFRQSHWKKLVRGAIRKYKGSVVNMVATHWLTEAFFDFSSATTKNGSKNSTSFTKFVFLGQSENKDGCPGIFYFSSGAAEWTLTKRDSKQVHNVLYKVCFLGHSENKHGRLGLWFYHHQRLHLVVGCAIGYAPQFLVHLSRSCPSSVRPSVVNFHIFNFSSETAKQNSTKLVSKQDLNVLYQVCVF